MQIQPATRISAGGAAAKALHGRLLRTHLLPHAAVHPKLLLLLRHPADASRWNSLLAAFARHGFRSSALLSFAILNSLGLPSDSYSLCSALTVASPDLARQIHARGLTSGCLSSVFVCGALIDCYARSLAVEDASQVFDEMPHRNTVCANSLLGGYVESRRWTEGFRLFRRMRELSLEPDGFTVSAVLQICSEAPAAPLGLQTHAYLLRRSAFTENAVLICSLVEMYARCGLVAKAHSVFDMAAHVTRKDVVLWTSMLNAYGRNGKFAEVVETYEKMLLEGIEPDKIALLAVLSACSHSGNVIKGLNFFNSILRVHGMVPGAEHYGCVIDMLCKAGNLEMAWKFANEMMMMENKSGGGNLNASVWGALLSACRNSGNVEIGKIAAKMALEFDPYNAGIHVEWSNLYASAGLWNEIGEVRELMKVKGLKKDVGHSQVDSFSLRNGYDSV
ncbi:putative pentatricopeptide repeat-containing protein At3g15130 [Zingiber officinale]|uniref:Pentatricopeptide repeat-containing protein n=1 Tax=Zingiber officinale TaxID=94328 RepID=A0A8J5LST0_ZINOF|nr:putative pentatricopeptide repeat-containing protein At3g15130 [Zingiber officinale]KAG6522180.1 hypothetical protein ZIOFF_019317 [Zingiber officinale]